jgi:hypothetical protein
MNSSTPLALGLEIVDRVLGPCGQTHDLAHDGRIELSEQVHHGAVVRQIVQLVLDLRDEVGLTVDVLHLRQDVVHLVRDRVRAGLRWQFPGGT